MRTSEVEIRSVAYLREIQAFCGADDPGGIAAGWAADRIETLDDAVKRAERLLSVCTFDEPKDLADLAVIRVSVGAGSCHENSPQSFSGS